jgi:hypothetical protein
MADDPHKQVAFLGPREAERIHIPIARPEILHADTLPAIQLLDRKKRRFAVGTQIGAGRT